MYDGDKAIHFIQSMLCSNIEIKKLIFLGPLGKSQLMIFDSSKKSIPHVLRHSFLSLFFLMEVQLQLLNYIIIQSINYFAIL